jgi:hypothetical protein
MFNASIEAAIDTEFRDSDARVKRLQQLREVERMARAFAERFKPHVPRVRISVCVWEGASGIYVEVSLGVRDFRDATPMIEFVEGWTPAALECTATKDWPQFRQRDFHFGADFRLSCSLDADAESCRAVVVGMKPPEPIYQFQCDEVAP